ncbi:hypothetical protein IMZ48_10330 [Candidatus Bathyarchaeota archaeon]|nr:hypothetical protein [Candidatus Bathyarchaeota archaeon]
MAPQPACKKQRPSAPKGTGATPERAAREQPSDHARHHEHAACERLDGGADPCRSHVTTKEAGEASINSHSVLTGGKASP